MLPQLLPLLSRRRALFWTLLPAALLFVVFFAFQPRAHALPAFDCASVTTIPQAECEALVALYDATGGDNWYYNSGWLTNPDPCQWPGITCHSGHVTEIHLIRNRLTGSIPAQVGQLTNLRVLNLSDNITGDDGLPIVPRQSGPASPEGANLAVNLDERLPLWVLGGPIPPELGQLTNLRELYLHRNNFSDPIPAELGQLMNLQILDLHGNWLDGSIPVELGQLANLEVLNLSRNWLTGSIPAELGQLANLRELDLYYNSVSGLIPDELGQLTSLENLTLSFNELSGSIPGELGQLSSLRILFLHNNALNGPIPAELGQLTNLQHLWLYNNQLSGAIPAELGQLANLRWLDLYNNQLSGAIPDELGQLTNLSRLLLNDNELCGEIPVSLANLTSVFLNGFSIASNYLIPTVSDPALEAWLNAREPNWAASQTPELCPAVPFCATVTTIPQAECEALVTLYDATGGDDWYYNSGWLTNPDPCQWLGITCHSGHVTEIHLTGNRLTGSIPAQVSLLTNLRVLNLFANAIGDDDLPIPPRQSGPPSPEGVKQAVNPDERSPLWVLGGPIPPELGQLTSLEVLILSRNQFTDPIPAELGQLINLQILDLHSNSLTGSIPAELGQLTNLESLNMARNQLSGAIPAELGQLANLQHLELSINQLSGLIPDELGQLTSLQTLRLNNNELCGEIPVSLANLTQVSSFSIASNYLIPTVSDPALEAWLNAREPNWAESQTEGPCQPVAVTLHRSGTDGGGTATVTLLLLAALAGATVVLQRRRGATTRP